MGDDRSNSTRPAVAHTRREVLRYMGSALGTAGVTSLLPLTACDAPRPRGDRPNVVVIMTDDQGYQDLGCYGSPDIRTPRIDRMASEGLRFTDFYAAPQCTAARVAFMTGCYAARVGDLKRTGVGTRTGLHPDEVTLAEILKLQGYATHLVGKWHLGMAPMFSPLRHGFDSFFGMLTSNGQEPPLMRGETIVEAEPDQSELTERYTAEAVALIDAAGDTPFFLFLSHVMPHVPLSVSERFRGRSERGLYGDAVECVDWSCGVVLDALEARGLTGDTLVVFCSDNGPWLLKGPDGGSALPLRGGKGQVFEGGVRVPCIARWPGTLPSGRESDAVCGLIDLLPTIAARAGAPLPADRLIDGRDLWPLLVGADPALTPHDAFYFFRGSRLAAMRAGRWKWHLPAAGAGTGALYDLHADIGEVHDIADAHPERIERMRATLERFATQLEATRRVPGIATD